MHRQFFEPSPAIAFAWPTATASRKLPGRPHVPFVAVRATGHILQGHGRMRPQEDDAANLPLTARTATTTCVQAPLQRDLILLSCDACESNFSSALQRQLETSYSAEFPTEPLPAPHYAQPCPLVATVEDGRGVIVVENYFGESASKDPSIFIVCRKTSSAAERINDCMGKLMHAMCTFSCALLCSVNGRFERCDLASRKCLQLCCCRQRFVRDGTDWIKFTRFAVLFPDDAPVSMILRLPLRAVKESGMSSACKTEVLRPSVGSALHWAPRYV